MGLVYCPECGTKASDKASVCPFCGFRSSTKNLPMIASKKPLKRIQWESSSLASEFDQVFPISTIQNNNLNIIFGRAENLSRIAPAFFQAIMSMLPKTIKVAEINPAIQRLIDKGVYKFLTDKNGEILPSIFGDKEIVAQVRLKDIKLTPDLGRSIVDLQTQIALAQVISEIHDVQRGIANLHSELQDDKLALAVSAWQQLQQAAQISNSRVREEKLLGILSSATEAKCILFERLRVKSVSSMSGRIKIGCPINWIKRHRIMEMSIVLKFLIAYWLLPKPCRLKQPCIACSVSKMLRD